MITKKREKKTDWTRRGGPSHHSGHVHFFDLRDWRPGGGAFASFLAGAFWGVAFRGVAFWGVAFRGVAFWGVAFWGVAFRGAALEPRALSFFTAGVFGLLAGAARFRGVALAVGVALGGGVALAGAAFLEAAAGFLAGGGAFLAGVTCFLIGGALRPLAFDWLALRGFLLGGGLRVLGAGLLPAFLRRKQRHSICR